MPKKPKQEDPAQYKRFLKKAKELGCEDLGKLDDVMKPELLKPSQARTKKS